MIKKNITNASTVNIKVTRGELIRIMMAVASVQNLDDPTINSEWWGSLHDNLRQQLEKFDNAE